MPVTFSVSWGRHDVATSDPIRANVDPGLGNQVWHCRSMVVSSIEASIHIGGRDFAGVRVSPWVPARSAFNCSYRLGAYMVRSW